MPSSSNTSPAKRTILYYPTIAVPPGDWLRQAVFYFDEVASIVPQEVRFGSSSGELLIPLSPELALLRAEGVFRAISAEALTDDDGRGENWAAAHRLMDDFQAAIRSDQFQALLAAHPPSSWVRIHEGKLTGTVLGCLQWNELVKEVPADDPGRQRWLLVEERAAMLYMSLLAQYLAEVDRQATVPGTDIVEHETAALRAAEGGLPAVEVRLRNAVPTPRADVSIGQILDFKRARASELLAYRAHVDTLFADLATTDSPSAVRDALVRFDEAQRRDLANLAAALDDARVTTRWGTVKAIVKANTPAFWGGAAVAAGFAATAQALPLSITLAGMAVVGAIEAKAYRVDKRNERRATLRNSPLAYLYHARQEQILDAR